MEASSLADWMRLQLAQIESVLTQILPAPQTAPTHLHEAMRYAVLLGGKRIRPLLCLAAAEFAQASPHAALVAGSAVELIHAYSLVHDDMPCMDNDVLRRGQPTVHVAFGEATALLVGDSLQPLAFGALTSLHAEIGADATVLLTRWLADAAGSQGMAGGQAIDLAAVGLSMAQLDLEQMHRLKTGALLRAAVLMGACAQRQTPPEALVAALDRYARCIGLAFQVVDDCLDVSADTATLGKTAGKDAQAAKPTFVSLMGLGQAQAYAGQLHQQALEALAPFDVERSLRLRQLADLIVSRSS